MIRMMVVDDEPVIREGIVRAVDGRAWMCRWWGLRGTEGTVWQKP